MDLHREKEYFFNSREAVLCGFFYCEIINKVFRFWNPKTGAPLAEVRAGAPAYVYIAYQRGIRDAGS